MSFLPAVRLPVILFSEALHASDQNIAVLMLKTLFQYRIPVCLALVVLLSSQSASAQVQPSCAAYDYWIVTNRSCPLQGETLQCCRFDYWNVNLDAAAPSSLAPFERKPQAEFQQSLVPGVPVCIVVHGSYVDWNSVRHDSLPLFRWIRGAESGRPLQVIFYSWPSEPLTYLPHIDFNVLGHRAGLNGFYLSQLLMQIPPDSPVCLLGHSQGTRVISSFLHLQGGGVVEGRYLPDSFKSPHELRAVFTAAAIDHDWLNPGQRYGAALSRVNGLLNLKNCQDWALSFYHFRKVGGDFALAVSGFTPQDYRQMGTLSCRVRELNVAPIVGGDHTWPGYYQRPELAEAMVPYVYWTDRELAPAPPGPEFPYSIQVPLRPGFPRVVIR